MALMPRDASESIKQAARRPKPPFPSPGSASWLNISSRSNPSFDIPSLTLSSIPKFTRYSLRSLPIKNSIEK